MNVCEFRVCLERGGGARKIMVICPWVSHEGKDACLKERFGRIELFIELL